MTHTAISHPELPTFRVISALTIKIPDPIMLPATTMVASNRVRDGLKLIRLFKNCFRFPFLNAGSDFCRTYSTCKIDSFIYILGDCPVTVLNTRLKFVMLLNPQSYATVDMLS